MAQWIGIGITVLLVLLGWAISYGKNKQRWDEMENELAKHTKHHEDHYKHTGDDKKHWTERERDDLSSMLQEMRKDLKELLVRNGGPRSC